MKSLSPEPNSAIPLDADRQLAHAGAAIAASLEVHGVDRVYSVPGESYLALLDGLHDTAIRNIVCRQEGGAAYMADAHGKLTGRAGVALVTRGPGAANGFIGVHSAWQDASPLVLFVGMVPTGHRYRESFQEFDLRAWFGTQAKRVIVLEDPDRASEIVAEAFHIAETGRPGPVVVGLPENIVASPFSGELRRPITPADPAVNDVDLAATIESLVRAERPLVLVGGEGWTPEGSEQLRDIVERLEVPVAEEWHGTGRVNRASPSYIGTVGYGATNSALRALSEADVLVSIGAIIGDVITDSYSIPRPADSTTILISPDSELRGSSVDHDRHILASPASFVQALTSRATLEPSSMARSQKRTIQLRTEYTDSTVIVPPPSRGRFASMTRVMDTIARSISDPIVTMGAGNHTAWAPMLPSLTYPSELATRNGSMGYSIPAAVVASLEHPERIVIAVAGDGEFLMNGQELATAAQSGARFLVVVMDNSQFGTIRVHQEREYPHRISGTQLKNPDFAGLARAYGGHGETIARDDQIDDAVGRAIEAVKTRSFALLHVIVEPSVLIPDLSISASTMTL